ncbi:hypothetical protein R1flu_024379 [Riccia fluitans]|uniref:Uncharacterized protein n=1 Tax=Riccia fluitans TaxID=41844 RepID=A0ABD1XUV7_9MARC
MLIISTVLPRIQGRSTNSKKRMAMVGLFSRISGKTAHRPQQSLEKKEVNDIVKETPVNTNGVEQCEEFSPVEHPSEPPDIDKPVRCPPPEPCIVHDGRIWKERVVIARRRMDMVKEKESSMPGRRRKGFSSERVIVSSHSAPDHLIQKYLD